MAALGRLLVKDSPARSLYDLGALAVRMHMKSAVVVPYEIWLHLGFGNLNSKQFTVLQLHRSDGSRCRAAAALGHIALHLEKPKRKEDWHPLNLWEVLHTFNAIRASIAARLESYEVISTSELHLTLKPAFQVCVKLCSFVFDDEPIEIEWSASPRDDQPSPVRPGHESAEPPEANMAPLAQQAPTAPEGEAPRARPAQPLVRPAPRARPHFPEFVPTDSDQDDNESEGPSETHTARSAAAGREEDLGTQSGSESTWNSEGSSSGAVPGSPVIEEPPPSPNAFPPPPPSGTGPGPSIPPLDPPDFVIEEPPHGEPHLLPVVAEPMVARGGARGRGRGGGRGFADGHHVAAGTRSYSWGGFAMAEIWHAGLQIGWGVTCNRHESVAGHTPCKKQITYGKRNPLSDDECKRALKTWILVGFTIDDAAGSRAAHVRVDPRRTVLYETDIELDQALRDLGYAV